MSPKKKTKLHRMRKSNANKANLKKRANQIHAVTTLLDQLDKEDSK
ncbi:MAG: hypothetical protein HQM14_09545 [SAR324 cluster bacterium]|nr:hypothetical protein [SAR324 cluster bacterium]